MRPSLPLCLMICAVACSTSGASVDADGLDARDSAAVERLETLLDSALEAEPGDGVDSKDDGADATDVPGDAGDGDEPGDVDVSPGCSDGEINVSVALCDPSFTTCDEVDGDAPAYLRGSVGIQAHLSCEPPKPYRVFLQIDSDVADVAPIIQQCDDATSCARVFAPTDLNLLENVKVSAKVVWGPGWTTSDVWSRVLPVYSCALDPEHLFCLQFGAWEAQPFPVARADEVLETVDIVKTSDGSIRLLGRLYATTDIYTPTALVFAVLHDGEWTSTRFEKGSSPAADDALAGSVHGALSITEGGFEAFFLPSPPQPARLITYDGTSLASQDVIDYDALRACGAPGDDRSTRPLVALASVGGTRHVFFSEHGEIAYLTDGAGAWSCVPFVTTYASGLIPPCDEWWQQIDGSLGVLKAGLAVDANGTLHLAIGVGGGYLLHGILAPGESWSVDAIPLFGQVPEPGEHTCETYNARSTGLVRGDGGLEVVSEQMLQPPYPYPAPLCSLPYVQDTITGQHIRRTRLSGDRVDLDEDLTRLGCDAAAGPLLVPFPEDTSLFNLGYGNLSVDIDSCDRIHGTIDSWIEGSHKYDFAESYFTNLGGAWSVTSHPEFGPVRHSFPHSIFVLADGALLFLTTMEGGGFRVFRRPCLQVLAD